MVLGKTRRELTLWERGIKKELQAMPSPLAGRLPEKEPVRQKEQCGEMQWEEADPHRLPFFGSSSRLPMVTLKTPLF